MPCVHCSTETEPRFTARVQASVHRGGRAQGARAERALHGDLRESRLQREAGASVKPAAHTQ